MKDIAILMGGKVVNGLFGLLLFHVIKQVLFPSVYIEFSNCLAVLTLLATFSAGAISGLMLKQAFNSKENAAIVLYWTFFFLLLSVLVIEMFISTKQFPSIYRMQAYAYLFTNLFVGIVLIDFQLKQKFLWMLLLDSLRLIFPLLLIILLTKLMDLQYMDLAKVLWLLVLGNVFGTIYFFIKIRVSSAALKDFSYFRKNWKSDLFYSFWFSAFNALAQLLITFDRQWIAKNHNELLASKIAYTADQVTRIANGILFPINTKISSQLGILVREKKITIFNRTLRYGVLLSLAMGLLLVICISLATFVINYYHFDFAIDNHAAIFYAIGASLYLSALILQKRFDYTKFKATPTLILLLMLISGLFWKWSFPSEIGLYNYVNIIYFLLMVIITEAVRKRLVMDR